MLSWLGENLATILISLVLAAAVAAIIAGLVRDKRKGKSSCGGNCASCHACRSCKTDHPA